MKRMNHFRRPVRSVLRAGTAVLAAALMLPASSAAVFAAEAPAPGNKVTLRVCNWEEYIDLGDWGEDEVIDLESGISRSGTGRPTARR